MKHLLRRTLIGALGLLIVASPALLAQDAEPRFSVPGGVAELRLEKASDARPVASFGLKELIVLDDSDHWRILIGISLDTLPGDYVVYTKATGSDEPAQSFTIQVRQKRYPVSDTNLTTKRDGAKFESVSEIEYENTVPPKLPLRLPVSRPWHNDFGTVSVNITRAQNTHQQNHLSLDMDFLSDKAQQVVQAPQDGIISRIVQQADDATPLFSLYIAHGRGLYSILHGLTDISVDKGNGVVAGAVLGSVANTENGATLHWQTLLNGAFVNPLILTQLRQ